MKDEKLIFFRDHRKIQVLGGGSGGGHEKLVSGFDT